MKKPIILELRGTGVLLRVSSVEDADMQILEKLAASYGEKLSTAWFDPAFRWREKVRTILEKVIVLSESRGLNLDGRSFLEVRQLRKRRRKFTMNELLGANQLFPIVKRTNFSNPTVPDSKNLILEITHGVGCMGRFETDSLNLAELEFAVSKLPHQNQKVALLMSNSGVVMECLKDDFLVRRNEFLRHS